jgi:predicted nuclease of predicted toxin-antitoxin system
MKFLIDAQLPRALAVSLLRVGIEAIHTLDLPDGNRTKDRDINDLSIKQQYIVVTKDTDFVESFVLYGKPWKLLLVATGNIGNSDLEKVFLSNVQRILEGFKDLSFVELNQSNVIFHR